jgi:pyrroloquinoline-quinone synthase
VNLLTRIDAIIEKQHLLQHSFYRKWTEGTLPLRALQDYACQYYSFESAFPRFLSALHSRTEEPEARAALLENLWDEEHGAANHRELWLDFAAGIGVAREQAERGPRTAATEALLASYRRASTEAPVAAGIAAIYAYERQLPEVAEAKLLGLRDHYGITDESTLAFFKTHATIDVHHAEAERSVLRATTSEGEAPVLAEVSHALDAWWRFLDAVDG